ncbi:MULTISPECIES: sensor histidine kinase [Pontibacter]|uniref:Histidine kinase n=1 Tax=Pontibacter lucknowensis TaxID=1077936 RepID=A0A1N6U8U8_9BACT|nr:MULTISPECIES: histidine kinase [Pontibacter]EJF11802.1 putative signal transduction histidine kinase [Pontibacter sp. BAB1700]SIQ61987.1 Histidine kinase [Pontibacter lucknowensis]
MEGVASQVRLMLLYLGWALLWSVVLVLVLWQTGFALNLILTDALLMNVLLAVGGFAVGTGLRFYQPSIRQGAFLLGWSLGLAGICTLLFDFIMGQMQPEATAYLAFVDKTLPMRIAFGWLMLLLMLLLTWLWFYTRQLQEAEKRKAATEKLAREAELYNLRQQLQPHFLFNSLNSISALVVSRPEQARTMVQQLSDFLRGTLRKDNSQLVPLAEELKQLQLYLDIEKVRFGHRLQVAVEATDESQSMKLPALLLQPVVENAIKFGLYDTVGETTIKVKATTADGYLTITTQNPYDPATSQPRKGTGFGLDSIQRRLYLLYARQDLLRTSQQDHQFTTTIKIPQHYEKMPDNR